MNKPEKKSLIIGGSILGGLVFAFVLYKKFKSKPETTTDEVLVKDSESDLGSPEEQISAARGKRTFLPSSDDDSNLLFNSDDDSVSDTSLSKSGGQKKKKSRRKRKTNKSKKNRKRRSKKNKKSRK